ncbi:MAG: PHP domain-containing protein [Firmicutes bacterium]|nr:PHP domain-containing protein [Bacillota bacterium]
MKEVLFRADKTIRKANLHCHTTVSDGALAPEKIKEIYMARGYGAVAFSDHNVMRDQSSLSDGSFLAINACEMGIGQDIPGEPWDNVKTYHMNLYATRPDMTRTPPLPDMGYGDIDAINRYIADRTAEGFLVCYNHPYWSLQDSGDYCKLKGLFAMEIYNHGCETEGCYGYNPQAYDEMLRAGGPLCCLSTDDNHNRHPAGGFFWDSFGGFTMINSGGLKYGDVIGALRRGDFYSSRGPEIYEISLDGGALTVKCSDASLIAVFTDGRKCYLKYGEALGGAEIGITGKHRYIRVTVRDKNGKDANSKAYWL